MKDFKITYEWSENDFRTKNGTFSIVKDIDQKAAVDNFLAEFNEEVSVNIIKVTEATGHGNAGNKNAAKPEPLTAKSYIRCKIEEKNAWVKTAQANGMKLAEWQRTVLNEAAGIG